MSDNLTQKQRLFVEAYIGVANGNATEAARMAGYSGNSNTLAQRGIELVRNSKVAALVKERVDEAVMSANEVLSELADIARADWREFVSIQYDKDGKMLDATLRLTDKIKALELVGKHHKLFTDKSEITGKDGGPVEQSIVFKRANDSGDKDN